MESKHTPGPWVWKYYDNLDCYKLVAIGDYGFHSNGDKVEPQIHSDGSACGEYGADIDVHGPDAKLIAAAPDMFKIIQRFATVEWMGLTELNLHIKECREIVKRVTL